MTETKSVHIDFDEAAFERIPDLQQRRLQKKRERAERKLEKMTKLKEKCDTKAKMV